MNKEDYNSVTCILCNKEATRKKELDNGVIIKTIGLCEECYGDSKAATKEDCCTV